MKKYLSILLRKNFSIRSDFLEENGMEYVVATPDMINDIYDVLHTAIKTIYPKYYPNEVVDFFCEHHSKEHILDGMVSGSIEI